MTDTTTEPNTFGIAIEPTHLGQLRDDKGWEHNLWSVTLRKDGRTMVTEYRMGLGLVDPPKRFSHRPRRKDELPTPRTPALIEVLHSLQMDANVVENDEFEDIGINEMTYREGQAFEAAVRASRDKTRTLLGRDYRAFLETEYDA